MKTTFDIPDDLLQRAKVTAARAGTTMRSLVIEGLAHTVAAAEAGDRSRQPAWRAAFGGMHQHRKESRRMMRSIDKEFGQIDDELWK